MTIQSEVSPAGDVLTISIAGRFDFSAHQDFRGSYEACGAKPRKYRIDLQEATYLDSSALGMLLLLRDHAGGDSAEVEILNCCADVRKILSISNFDQLFAIH